jgi:hypothetical protein
MYNEEASKYDASMATGFALLSIDKEGGTPSTGPKWVWKQLVTRT